MRLAALSLPAKIEKRHQRLEWQAGVRLWRRSSRLVIAKPRPVETLLGARHSNEGVAQVWAGESIQRTPGKGRRQQLWRRTAAAPPAMKRTDCGACANHGEAGAMGSLLRLAPQRVGAPASFCERVVSRRRARRKRSRIAGLALWPDRGRNP